VLKIGLLGCLFLSRMSLFGWVFFLKSTRERVLLFAHIKLSLVPQTLVLVAVKQVKYIT